MTKQFQKNNKIKQYKINKDNDYDRIHIDQLLSFRNLQLQDKNFDRKKEKVLWPIFEFKPRSPSDSPDKSKDIPFIMQ